MGPSAKKQQMARDLITPFLGDGESISLVTAAQVGQVSAKRQVTTMAAAALLSGGLLTVYTRPAGSYIVVTNERLFFLPINRTSGKPVAAGSEGPYTVSRPVRLEKAGGLLYAAWHLTDPGGTPLLRLSYAVPDRPEGPKLAAALA
jgi:hypothetical protein